MLKIYWITLTFLVVCVCVSLLAWSITRYPTLAQHVLGTVMDTNDKGLTWSPYMDVLTETEAFREHRDMQYNIDVKKSVVRIVDQMHSYKVGDDVRVNIHLYNSQGNPLTVGGDKLLVRIFEEYIGAGASGYILDHMNGTYTAVVKCLWVGQPHISVSVDLAREDIRFLYDFFRKTEFTRTILVTYKNEERRPCHAFREWLNTSEPICNMTDINGGMSWFCVAPKSDKMTCSNVYKFQDATRVKGEELLTNRPSRASFSLIKLNVTGESHVGQQITKTKPSCSAYNRTRLWFSPSPVGYFIHRKWVMTHCRAPPVDTFGECLRNKNLIFYGDSTSRQWHSELCARYSCKTCLKTPKNWIHDKWKLDFSVYCDRLNLSMDWVGASFPGNLFRNFSNAAATHIFNYVNNKNMVFVMHHHAHLVWYHPRVYRDRIRNLRLAIERFLKQNKDAMFFIKGPNSHVPKEAFRYFSYVYRIILIEEFRGLYDKVIYLDNADATVAMKQTSIHPDDFVVTGMVDQMISYICK